MRWFSSGTWLNMIICIRGVEKHKTKPGTVWTGRFWTMGTGSRFSVPIYWNRWVPIWFYWNSEPVGVEPPTWTTWTILVCVHNFYVFKTLIPAFTLLNPHTLSQENPNSSHLSFILLSHSLSQSRSLNLSRNLNLSDTLAAQSQRSQVATLITA